MSSESVVLTRAMRVLFLFEEGNETITAQDVAARLDVTRSTAYRYLQSLRSLELIWPSSQGKGYRLGPAVLRLARTARKGGGVLETIQPVMRQLADDVNEVVLLQRRFGQHVVCIEREEADHVLRLTYEPGQVLSVNASASGRVLLAWEPENEIRAIVDQLDFRAFTTTTITSPTRFLKELESVRRNGFAVSRGELDEVVVGIAAPVRDLHDDVIGCLSVAAAASRIQSDDDIDRLRIATVNAAERATAELRARGARW